MISTGTCFETNHHHSCGPFVIVQYSCPCTTLPTEATVKKVNRKLPLLWSLGENVKQHGKYWPWFTWLLEWSPKSFPNRPLQFVSHQFWAPRTPTDLWPMMLRYLLTTPQRSLSFVGSISSPAPRKALDQAARDCATAPFGSTAAREIGSVHVILRAQKHVKCALQKVRLQHCTN